MSSVEQLNGKNHISNRRYWRSLERLVDSSAALEGLKDEFPEGAASSPGALTRREVLRLMAASMALAGAVSCRRPVEKIVPFVTSPENVIPGVPRHYATTMPLGTCAYGVVVESHEGRPTKIEGNERHPASLGAANAWMQAAVLDLYDPDRARRVLRRANRAEALRASSWQEFADFWKDRSQSLQASNGRGLALLSQSYSSPTQSRLSRQFRERFPEARWAVYEPLGDTSIAEGLLLATGETLRPVHQLENAKIILALDADLLLTQGDSLRLARAFAAGRRDVSRQLRMNRLYVVESAYSTSGAAADHRWALPRSRIALLAAALALRLQALGLPLGLPEDDPGLLIDDPRLPIVAEDLAAHPGEALIVAGQSQPPAVHALVCLLNEALGALGRTLSFREPKDTAWPDPAALHDLVQAMRRGEITTLILADGNPVYTAPADAGFADALGRVPEIVHLSSHLNETSRLAHWHLPQSHFLESWGDTRSTDGSASVIQPLIAPLFQSRSVIELLAQLIRDRETGGYELVRETWLEEVIGGSEFESRWAKTLHDGVLEKSAPPPIIPVLSGTAGPRAYREIVRAQTLPNDDTLEVVFVPSPALYDGRFANNGWLQELPDPITKITWDNAALISPASARRLQLLNGEIVRLHQGETQIEIPAWLVPGQADDCIVLPLGYGREAAGRIGNGVGTNVYPLRSGRHPHFAGRVRLEKTGRLHSPAQTQEHWSMEGRSLFREADLEAYRANPNFAAEADAELKTEPLWEAPHARDGYQWGMLIDLNTCIGCNACVLACQSENNIPIVGREQVLRGREMHWLRIDRYFEGPPEAPRAVFQPVPCMHCENAPCEQVCPVGATVHDREGLNAQIYNRCIGTRYCSNNCPYKVRRFNFFNYTKDLPELVQLAMNPDVTVRSRGVMEKCTYCIQRINQVKRAARREGRMVRDGEMRTACQQTCPTDAIVFGDLNDENSRVSRQKRDGRHYVLLAELNNKPRTSYLAKIRNPNPNWPQNDWQSDSLHPGEKTRPSPPEGRSEA